jgi:hypothetical protein
MQKKMKEMDFDEMGLTEKENGKETVVGYVKQSDLTDGLCENHMWGFQSSDVVSSSTSLVETMKILQHIKRVYVRHDGNIDGIVTKGDLQKLPVRMFLFGHITLLEIQFAYLIRHFYPNDTWKGHFDIDKGKIRKAEHFLNKAKARNEALFLSDYLGLDTKGKIVVEARILNEAVDMAFVKRLYEIRNYVAHGDDILGNNSWEDLLILLKG